MSLALNAEIIEWVLDRRERIRVEAGGGACAGALAQAVAEAFDWPVVRGIYLSSTGEPIASHAWNRLPDGGIFDGTSDRFGEGFDYRYLVADETDLGRYRVLAHPIPCSEGGTAAPDPLVAAAEALQAQRGPGWWLSDTTLLRAFLIRQESYRRDRVKRSQRVDPRKRSVI